MVPVLAEELESQAWDSRRLQTHLLNTEVIEKKIINSLKT